MASAKRRIERCVIRRAQCLKEFREVFGACNAKGNKIAYLWVIVAELLVEYVEYELLVEYVLGSIYKPLRSQKLVFANDFEYSFRKWNIKT